MLNKQQLFDLDKLVSCYLMDIIIYIVIGFVLLAFGAYISDTFLSTSYTSTINLHTVMTVVIYAEIFAMLAKYLESHEVPIEFVAYLVITALARNLLVKIEELSDASILANSAGILITILALVAYRYHYNKQQANNHDYR